MVDAGRAADRTSMRHSPGSYQVMSAQPAKPAAAVGQIDGPRDLLRSSEHVVNDLQKLRFTVGDPTRHQPFPVAIDDNDVVVTLAGVDPGPDLLDTIHSILLRERSGWSHRRARRPFPTQRSGRRSQSAVETSRSTGRPIGGSHHTAEN
jgi:hypothetical protein